MRFVSNRHWRLAGRTAAAILIAGATLFGSSEASGQRQAIRPFSHEPHRQVSCRSCHEMEGENVGAARVTQQQCHSCHHTGPVAGACTRCHVSGQLSQPYPSMQQFRLSISPVPVSRMVVFDHQQHDAVECRSCHKRPPLLEAGALSCSTCHDAHHAPDVDCRSCHESRRDGAHGIAVHSGCGGSDCHDAMPVQTTARTRQFCLTCHPEQAPHRPAGNCIDCHLLPSPSADANHALRRRG